ncbi:MAG TPA: alkaline phosphatase family protein [Acidimicrobiales bacterium]|nr:alkaline phosphatase family protein [Acidimicrobiales bacterium]
MASDFKRKSLIAAAVLAATGAAAAARVLPTQGAAPHQTGTARLVGATGASAEGVPSLSHVFVIIGENTSYTEVTPSRAPYINDVLKPESAWLTTYSALHGGSLADYIGMTSGQYQLCDVNDDQPYQQHCHQSIPNLFGQLDAQGVSWKEWSESSANPCDFYDSGTDWAFDIYTTHHNPAVYYDNVTGGTYQDFVAPNNECLTNVVPMGSTAPDNTSVFDADLKTGNVPRFNFVIPNDCEDGHDICGRSLDTVGQFDAFLKREVPKIMASPAFDANSVIIVTYDEWDDSPLPPPGDHRVVFMVTGAPVQPGVYAGGPYAHYSFLRTMEDAFGLRGHILAASKALPINTIWKP